MLIHSKYEYKYVYLWLPIKGWINVIDESLFVKEHIILLITSKIRINVRNCIYQIEITFK